MFRPTLERRRPLGRRVFLCLCLALTWIHGGNNAIAATDYSTILDSARAGDFDRALPALRRLVEAHPDNHRYRDDFITVLGWAGRDQAVLDHTDTRRLDDYPTYVLETVAKAARNRKRYALAAAAYETALRKTPDRLPSELGLVLTLADDGHPQQALKRIQSIYARQPDNLEVLRAYAYVQQRRGAWFEQFALVNRILAQAPDDPDALHDRAWLVHRLGAPSLALAMAERHPDLFTAAEVAAFRSHLAALRTRWGRLPQGPAGEAANDTDRAISLLEQQIDELKNNPATPPRLLQRSRFDLLAALRDKGRHQRVVELYERLREQGIDCPPYVQIAAADAYLALRRPETARDLYEQALAEGPEDFEAGISLFYAYLEAEDFGRALEWIDQLAANQPVWLAVPGSNRRKANRRRLQADTIAALGRAYADNLAAAQARLEPMVTQAPANIDLRTNLGTVYLWRGWPHRARATFRLAAATGGDRRSVRVALHEVSKGLNDFRRARTVLDDLAADFPDNSEVRRLQRNWRIHNMRTLQVDAGGGRSSANQVGTHSLHTDTYLYSQPLDYHHRAYLHYHRASASFPEGFARYQRAGFGVETRLPDWQFNGELHRSFFEDTATVGVGVKATWLGHDHWQVSAGYDSQDTEVPLRGRPHGLTGDDLSLDIGYRFSDLTSVGGAIHSGEYSDDNQRDSASFSLFRRLVNGPHYKLDGRVSVYASRNSLRGAPYYNPRSDLSSEFTLENDWLTWRRYSRSFRQRLAATVGRYNQEGFATETFWALRYEQAWSLYDRFGLSYGIAPSRMVYDGAHESIVRFFLNLNVRF